MRTRAGLALLACLLLAAPAHAASHRAQAEEALARVEQVLDGRGVRSGREATPALRRLAIRLGDLGSADRRRARGLLARPTDGAADQFGDGYSPGATVLSHCTDNFCVHWVTSGPDAPSLVDGPDTGTTPDYVDAVAAALETSYATQNGALGWAEPLSDGGDGKTDAYLKDLGRGLFGYAATDPGQGDASSQYGYLVLDDDYRAQDFPGFATPLDAMRVTAAHEYNHVLQFTYDFFQADWMYESTATWMEDQVFDAIDDYLNYVDPDWNTTTEIPLTQSDFRMYGSAVWNFWLSERYGQDAVRRAWEGSAALPDFLSPAAYDAGIAPEDGSGFGSNFGEFAAGVAEWRAQPPPGRAFSEGASYGDVERRGTLAVNSPSSLHTLDHTTFKLIDVPVPADGTPLRLAAALPAGVPGAVALVGRDGTATGGSVTTELAQLPDGGSGAATLLEPNRFDRITAVLANSSVRHDGLDGSGFDFDWRDDGRQVGVTLSTDPGAQPPEVEEPETPGEPPPSTGDTTTTPAPAPAESTTSTQPDALRPAVAGLRLRRTAFRAFRRRGASIAARRGTRVRYSLSEDAVVTFRVRRRLGDGRVRRVRGRFRHTSRAGSNRFRFTGRVRRRPLKPGRYVLRARAKDSAGNVSRVMRVRFRVVRR